MLRRATSFVAATALAGCILQARAPKGVAVVRHALGTVLVSRGAQSQPIAAKPKMDLYTGDTIRTRGDAWTLVSFLDGSNLLLGQGAEVVIVDLEPPDPWLAFLRLTSRSLRAKRPGFRAPGVSASLEDGPCDFRVYVDPETGRSIWDVLEGSLTLRDDHGRRVVVERRQRAVVDPGGGVQGPLPLPPTLSRALSEGEAPAVDAAAPAKAGQPRVAAPALPTGPDSAPADVHVSTATVGASRFPPVPDLNVLDLIFSGVPWSD